jgi:hypothetical protein
MTDEQIINQIRGEYSDLIDTIDFPEDTLKSFQERYKDKQVIFVLPDGYKTTPRDVIIEFEEPTVVAKIGTTTFKMSNFEKVVYSKEKKVILI